MEKDKNVRILEYNHKKKDQKLDISKSKSIINNEENNNKTLEEEYKTTKESFQTFDSSKTFPSPQKIVSSTNVASLPDKSSKENNTVPNKNSPSVSSFPFHRLVMSIQSMVGQESVSWNTNTGSSNKNYASDTINTKVDSWNSVPSLIHPFHNDMFRPSMGITSSKPINQPPSFNNILIHENDMDQKKKNYNAYQHFHLFNQSPEPPPPLFTNNIMMPSPLPSLSQGYQPLNQNMDRGKSSVMSHVNENYIPPAPKIMFPNKFNTVSPKNQKGTHSRTSSNSKSLDYHLNEQPSVECRDDIHRQSFAPKQKFQDTNHSPYKNTKTDGLYKVSQETLTQKKNQKEIQKHPLRPVVPLPKPKLIVKNDAVMSFIEGIEEKDLGEHIYAPSNPVPRLDGKLNGVLTIRIAKQYFYKSENDCIKKRALWGTDIYTDDSDIVAILLHTGRLGRKRPSSDAIVKVRVLPRLIKYSGSLRHNIMSRGWKTKHDGESIMVEDLKWVEDKTRKGRGDMKERIAARYRLQLSL
ncbi:hypothetical protein PCANB_001724 [Pneumocystis canis]|nr:hypothetical protein PCANB_001724 [Pneumocystis canis]